MTGRMGRGVGGAGTGSLGVYLQHVMMTDAPPPLREHAIAGEAALLSKQSLRW